jgi:Tol biopolymer transport system component
MKTIGKAGRMLDNRKSILVAQNLLFIPLLLLCVISIMGNTASPLQMSETDRNILFASYQDGIEEIYIMNPDGSGQRRLTRTPAEDKRPGVYRGSGDPAWSPDGSLIAFTSVQGEGDQESGIFIMNSRGRNQRLVCTGRYLGHLDWSPDGTRIAFSMWPNGQMGVCDIYIVDVENGHVRQLIELEGEERGPDWSPDGSRIIFPNRILDVSQLYSVNPDGTGLEAVQDRDGQNIQGRGPRWSPDGRKLAFISNNPAEEDILNSNIFVMDLNTRVVRQLTSFDQDRAFCHELCWSPDGNRLVFRSNHNYDPDGSLSTLSAYEIYMIDITSGEVRRLTTNESLDHSPAWW